MKLLIFLFSVIHFANLAAITPEEQDIKVIKDYYEGKTFGLKELIPIGFVKSGQAKGDLNGDGIDDLAIIIHKEIKKNNLSTNSKDHKLDDNIYDLPQYIILFTGEKLDRFTFWKLGTKHFINSTPDFMEENGIGIFEIKKGILTIGTSIARSMGGWSAGGCTQKWRNGKSGFQLIGITILEIDRKCACGTTTDTNLLTGNEILRSDKNANGEQMNKEKITKSKGKPRTILWDEFDYEKYCELQ